MNSATKAPDVKQIFETWIAGYAAGDSKKVMSVFDRDLRYIKACQPEQTFESLSAWYEFDFRRQDFPRQSWTFEIESTDVGGDLAVVVSQWTAVINSPIDLDVTKRPWPLQTADAILAINMIHVAPWPATLALFEGAKALLPPEGVLFLYGPYRRHGQHTSKSNEQFDSDLRAQNSEWGLRDLEAVSETAASSGFVLAEIVAMPANNFSLIFRRRDGG